MSLFASHQFERYFINDSLFIRKSNKGGVGIFASKDLEQYMLVEHSPFSSMFKHEWHDVPDKVRSIVFAHPIGSNTYVLGLGYLSLYNHDDDNNCIWSTSDIGIYVYTNRKINAGEELCIHYGDGYWSNGWNKI